MGSHTWFYNKNNRTLEEAKDLYVKNLEKDTEFIKNILKDDNYGGYDWKEYYEEMNIDNYEDFLNDQLKSNRNKINNINDLSEEQIYKSQTETSIYVNGKFYTMVEDFHDLFRTNYNNTKLFSLEETLKFIKENNCSVYDYTEKRLKEFWNKYPNGVIDFG